MNNKPEQQTDGQNKLDYDTGLFLGRRHKKDKSPPMYSNKDEMTQFVMGYIKSYYE